MGFQVYWVLFFITDNREFQHGIPGGLCFFFNNGQPKELGSRGVLGFIFITDSEEFQSPGFNF